jgi:hypothetical protein
METFGQNLIKKLNLTYLMKLNIFVPFKSVYDGNFGHFLVEVTTAVAAAARLNLLIGVGLGFGIGSVNFGVSLTISSKP